MQAVNTTRAAHICVRLLLSDSIQLYPTLMPVPPGSPSRKPKPTSGLFHFVNNKGTKHPVKSTGRHAVALGPQRPASAKRKLPLSVQGTVILASESEITEIVQNIVDGTSYGPANRVKAARSMIGIQYKQQTGTALRAGSTPEALLYMDCSEFVSRVLAIDGITSTILPMNTGAIKALVSRADRFEHSKDQPKVGDIALWEGHVGIVSGVGKGNTIKLIHASGKGKLSGENKYAISPAKYRSGIFYGYYRPINELHGNSVDLKNPSRFPMAKAASTPQPTRSVPGHRSNADGSFPLREIIVRPSPGQASDAASAPYPVVPKLEMPFPQNVPAKLPTK